MSPMGCTQARVESHGLIVMCVMLQELLMFHDSSLYSFAIAPPCAAGIARRDVFANITKVSMVSVRPSSHTR